MTIRTATICHNEDDRNDPNHRRVKLVLEREPEGFVWRTEDGEDCCISPQKTVHDAEIAAMQVWGADVWDLRATWRT